MPETRTAASPDDESGLRCEAVHASYGPVTVCRDVDLGVRRGEILALLGPNGAGKTSLVRAFGGLIRSEGRIWLDSTDMAGKAAHTRARLGLATVPDDRGLFRMLTVGENLQMGSRLAPKSQRSQALVEVFEAYPFLHDRRSMTAGGLSGGEQQMLAIAKALAGRPKALMLDEPSQGLAPKILDGLRDFLRGLRDLQLPVLLVEQNHGFARSVADRFCVMVSGRIVMRGDATDLADRDLIASAYLVEHSKGEEHVN